MATRRWSSASPSTLRGRRYTPYPGAGTGRSLPTLTARAPGEALHSHQSAGGIRHVYDAEGVIKTEPEPSPVRAAQPAFRLFPPARDSLAVWAGGGAAALAAWAGMTLLRYTLQVRSVPERLMEWLLVFVPLDVFEA